MRSEYPARVRFWLNVEPGMTDDECWIWQGGCNVEGYGRFLNYGRAHRLAYEMEVGPIPEGLVIDHLCRVRNCVNPSHMEPVTNRENVLRGVGITAKNVDKTHCPQGHEYTPENTAPVPTGGRRCRACLLAKTQRQTERRREARTGK